MAESTSPFDVPDIVECIIYYIAGYFVKQIGNYVQFELVKIVIYYIILLQRFQNG